MSAARPRLVWLDPAREHPIAVGLGACVHAISREQATDLRHQLGEILDEEMPTRRDTPLAMAAVRDTDPAPGPRTTSSGGFKAVTLPERGLDKRVADELAKGKDPPKSQG